MLQKFGNFTPKWGHFFLLQVTHYPQFHNIITCEVLVIWHFCTGSIFESQMLLCDFNTYNSSQGGRGVFFFPLYIYFWRPEVATLCTVIKKENVLL